VEHVARPEAHTFPHVLPLFGPDFNIEPHTFSETAGAEATIGDSETEGVGGAIGTSTISVTSVVSESDSDVPTEESEVAETTSETGAAASAEAKRVCFLQMVPSAHVMPHG
jgi:hypothetical protein